MKTFITYYSGEVNRWRDWWKRLVFQRVTKRTDDGGMSRWGMGDCGELRKQRWKQSYEVDDY